MKKMKFYLSFIVVLSLLFTSCSKDEETGIAPDSEKASLSFGAVVEDLVNKSAEKQSDIGDLPACSDDTAAYVEVVLMQGDTEVVGSIANPFRVDLVEGQVFTEEVPELELDPGTYSLDHFAVYNADDELIWLAPKGGVLAEFVDNPLPLQINLGAGVKKYVDVSVICYDDRDVNQYGYLFFELDMNEAFEYCFFANYCTPEGRHFPASYSVDISIDGTTIYSGVTNTTGTNEDGDFFAEPLCFALPDIAEFEDNEEYIDYTVTLLDWEDAYGDVEQTVITGSLSRAEIMANFDGGDNVEYGHLRFGCDDGGEEPPVDSDNDGVVDMNDDCPDTEAGVDVDANGCPVDEDPDSDGDGVVDSVDECDDEPGPASNNGCPEDTEEDSDGDGVVDSEDNCVNTANPGQEDTDGDGTGDACEQAELCTLPTTGSGCDVALLEGTDDFLQVNNNLPFDIAVEGGENFGSVTVEISEEGNLTLLSVLNVSEGLVYSGYEIYVSDSASIDGVFAAECGTIDNSGNIELDLGDIDAELGDYIRVRMNVCPAQ